ncbi:helix-turn-helix domain-containing protein [Rhizobium puerariae]|uniref:Helix-turn-helix domain-containing protein n=1 Tax=Rhizobium puerariae TaxID=1585791 RepID=A0ABV6AMX9_9HYPH
MSTNDTLILDGVEIDPDAVIDRLRKAMGVDSDTDLSTALGVNKSTVSAWRTRKRIPYAEVVQVAFKTRENIEWLLTGKERTQMLPGVYGGEINVRLLAATMYDVWNARIFQEAFGPGTDKWKQASFRAKWIADRYNHFQFLMNDMTAGGRMTQEEFTHHLIDMLEVKERDEDTQK